MSDARTHLQRLAEELASRQWTARLTGEGPVLRVQNPDMPELSEAILCSGGDDGWSYCWPWRETIGPVCELSGVADRIQHVLRGVES